jgi:hypothetical protein
MLVLSPPWTRQPQAGLTRAGKFAGIMGTSLVGSNPLADDGQTVVNVGAVGRTCSPFGTAMRFSAGTNMRRAIIRGSNIGAEGTGASLLGVFRTTTSDPDGRFVALGSEGGSTNNTIFAIGIAAPNLKVTVGGSLYNEHAYPTAAINNSLWHCCVVTLEFFSSTLWPVLRVFLNGRQVIGRTINNQPGGAALYNWIVANGWRRGGADNAGPECDVALAVPFHRPLSPNQAKELSTVESAWQLFAPRRIWIPVSVGAAAVAPTLTAAIAHNLGSTTVTPRVTFTR